MKDEILRINESFNSTERNLIMIVHHSISLNPSETTQTLPLVLPTISTVIYKLFGSEVYFNDLKQESRGFGMTFFGNRNHSYKMFFKDLKKILYK